MTGNSSSCILRFYSCFCTKNGYKASIQKGAPHFFIAEAKEVIDVLTCFPFQELLLLRRALTFPGIDRLSSVIRNPDPEGAKILPWRNMKVVNVGRCFLHPFLSLLSGGGTHVHDWFLILGKHGWIPIFSHAVEPQTYQFVWASCRRHPEETKCSIETQRISGSWRQIALGECCCCNGKLCPGT